MMEGFAEAVGEVAIIRFKRVGEGFAFGFEDKADAAIVIENLID